MRILAGLLLSAVAFAADVTGKWDVNVDLSIGSSTVRFDLPQSGEKVTGTYYGQLGERKLTGTVKGETVEIQFDGEYDGQKFTVLYKGTVEGGAKMSGKAVYGELADGTFTATKGK